MVGSSTRKNDIHGISREEATRRRHDRKIGYSEKRSAGDLRTPFPSPKSQFKPLAALLAAERPSRTREEVEGAEKGGDVREEVRQESEVHL